MKPATKAKFLKFFRVTHGWLGVFVFPWILVIGLTGIYLNHKQAVLGWIGTNEYDESQFAEWPGGRDLSLADALSVAQSVWPNEEIKGVKDEPYHGFASYVFKKESGRIIVTRDTGHYYVKTKLSRTTYAPDGTKLHQKIYWKSVFKWLHGRGWLNSTFGTWLADIAAGAMVVFSLSGLFMFFMPRAKKIRRSLAKLRPTKKAPTASVGQES